MAAIVDSTGGKLKIGSNVSGEPVYSYDSEIKDRIIKANLMSLDVNRRIAEVLQKEQGMTRVNATQLVIRQLDLNNSKSDYIKLGLSTGINQTKLSQFQPAQTIAQIRSNQTQQSNQNKKVISKQNIKPSKKLQTIVLSPAITTIQNQLIDLKKNPPSGTNKKAAATSYVRKRDQLKAKLVSILV